MDEDKLYKGRKVLIYDKINYKFIGKGIYLGSERFLEKDLTSNWYPVFKLKGDKLIYGFDYNWHLLKNKEN